MSLYEGCQNDMPNAKVKAVGCYFISIARMVERDFGKSIVPVVVSNYWYTAHHLGLINDNDEIVDAAGVYNLFAEAKVKTRVDKPTKKPQFPAYIVRHEKMSAKGIIITHYTLHYKGDDFDPLPPWRPAASTYHIAGYRVFI
jgi:hypothetical protein